MQHNGALFLKIVQQLNTGILASLTYTCKNKLIELINKCPELHNAYLNNITQRLTEHPEAQEAHLEQAFRGLVELNLHHLLVETQMVFLKMGFNHYLMN